MSVWFEGSNQIDCTIDSVKHEVENLGEHYAGVISLMPGLASVELVQQGDDSLTIRTNEGLMTRSGVSKVVDVNRVVVEFDEEYQAGSRITTRGHFVDEFTATDVGVTHHLVISDLTASGVLGFFYRNFGKSRIGRALLTAHKAYLEAEAEG
ncbi:MAG: hypothetical protein OEV40_12255 [Acidimicrobiia bacterium]|nr:hypothetical protein [Acidimicrobiia bacterium]